MAQKFKSDKPTMEEIVRLKKPNRKEAPILLDSELSAEITKKQQEIEALDRKVKSSRGKSLADTTGKELLTLSEELEALLDKAEESTVIFTFQDIGRKKYDDLVRDHPPTDDQKKEFKEQGGNGVLAYNPETFPQALMSKTCIQPIMTLEEAEKICEEWSEGDIETLFFTAIAACKERTSVPLSKRGIETTPTSLSDSTTAENEESPTLDS